MRNTVFLSGLILLVATTSAQAEWSGKGEAGLVSARGNTDSNSVNFKLGMTDEVDQWKHAFDLAMLYVTADGVSTANRYAVTEQSDYKLNANSFAFGGARYEKDHFSGFNYQASVTTGEGHKFIDTDAIKFSAQAGVGYRFLETDEKGNPANHNSSTAIITAGIKYENKVTATTKLIEKLNIEAGKDDTLLSNFIGVEVKVSTALALSVGLDMHYNSKPPTQAVQVPAAAPIKKLDTLNTVNLVYAF